MIISIETVSRNPVVAGDGLLLPSVIAVSGPYAPSGPVISALSSSSVTIGLGPKEFVVAYGLGFSAGTRVRAAVDGAPGFWMEGVVTDYGDNDLVILVDLLQGGGTYDDWLINVAGQPGQTGGIGPQGPMGESGDVEEAPEDGEIYGRKDGNWVPAGTSAISAGDIASIPTGDIAATDVQAALTELDADKLAKAGGTMTGAIVLHGDPAAALEAAPRQYVDAGDTAVAATVAAKVSKSGDVMGGLLTLSGAPSADLHAATKKYVDDSIGSGGTTVYVSATAPTGVPDNSLWWNTVDGCLYLRYNDGTSTAWIIAIPMPDLAAFAAYLPLAGGTLTGDLVIVKDTPTYWLNRTTDAAARIVGAKAGNARWAMAFGSGAESGSDSGSDFFLSKYSDAGVPEVVININRATGLMTLKGAPTAPLGAATKGYVDGLISASAIPADVMAFSGLQINGAHAVGQEIGSVAVPLTSGVQRYICDNWTQVFIGAGAVVQGQRVDSGANVITSGVYLPHYLMMQATTALPASSAAGDHALILQVIEGNRVARLGWGTVAAQPITVSFWANALIPGHASLAARNNAGDRSYVVDFEIFAGGTWEYKQITIPGDTTGTWLKDAGTGIILSFCFASGTNFQTSTPNTWVAFNRFSTLAQTNFLGVNNRAVYLAGVTVMPGSYGPPAANSARVQRPYDTEHPLCMRYWEWGNQPYTYTPVINSTYAYDHIQFKVFKRNTPACSMTGWTYWSSGAYVAFTPAGITPMNDEMVWTSNALTNWNGWGAGGIWVANSRY